jgi:hypothetical protein
MRATCPAHVILGLITPVFGGEYSYERSGTKMNAPSKLCKTGIVTLVTTSIPQVSYRNQRPGLAQWHN